MAEPETADVLVATIPKNDREEIRISLGRFKGYPLFNARVYYRGAEGDFLPGKGIAFKIGHLPAFAAAVEKAVETALATGWIAAE